VGIDLCLSNSSSFFPCLTRGSCLMSIFLKEQREEPLLIFTSCQSFTNHSVCLRSLYAHRHSHNHTQTYIHIQGQAHRHTGILTYSTHILICSHHWLWCQPLPLLTSPRLGPTSSFTKLITVCPCESLGLAFPFDLYAPLALLCQLVPHPCFKSKFKHYSFFEGIIDISLL
jgi:hypothetical protein